jgi:TM2 domain-containing membrane protein YozV
MPSSPEEKPGPRLIAVEIALIVAVLVIIYTVLPRDLRPAIVFVAIIAGIAWWSSTKQRYTAPGAGGKGDPLAYVQDLNEYERRLFMSEFSRVSKSVSTARLLALFLGGVGAHWFYLGKSMRGLLYLIFVWTSVPLILALIEVFTMGSIINGYNSEQAGRIRRLVLAMRPTQPAPAAGSSREP